MSVSNKSGAIPNDAVVKYAARALAAGDPLGAMNLVALRNDALGLALRGIAMAQLGDLVRARTLLKAAVRAFGPKDSVPRARCIVAEAEIALATRDLSRPVASLDAARTTLERHGDHLNAAHARFIEVRRLLLIGRLAEAEQIIGEIDPGQFPPALRVAYELVVAGIAVRRLRAKTARAALNTALQAALRSGVASLVAEIETALLDLDAPAAYLKGFATGSSLESGRLILLDEVEDILGSGALVVDACRRAIRQADTAVSLASRPLLFEIVRALGEAWPNDVPRNALIERAFEMLIDDDEDRLRLRVEVGRLRAALEPLAAVISTKRGFALVPHKTSEVVVLEPPVKEEHAAVLALLADGEAWSSSALALALSASQRSVQRALESLEASGKVQPVGRGRACRWVASPLIGFTTTLLLPGSLPTE
jgi:hypothetical protein